VSYCSFQPLFLPPQLATPASTRAPSYARTHPHAPIRAATVRERSAHADPKTYFLSVVAPPKVIDDSPVYLW